MTQDDGNKFTDEVSSRLSELFGKTEPSDTARDNTKPDHSTPQKDIAPEAFVQQDNTEFNSSKFSQFAELKAIVLSIEWEITDETMGRLIEETNKLQETHISNQVIISFLKLLGSVGKYVDNKKGSAHPDSIKLLHSIYEKLENVLTSSIMTESKIKTILSGEVKKFKDLRQKLLDQVDPSAGKKIKPTVQKKDRKEAVADVEIKKSEPESISMSSSELLLQKIDEIETLIKEEFERLRGTLKSFRQ